MDDLGITIPSARGARGSKAKKRVEVAYVRDLTAADIAALHANIDLGALTPAIQKIRHSHHNIARLLASGVKAVEISIMTGYSQSRISILQGDPAFKELVSYYAAATQKVNIEVIEKLRDLGIDALQEIQDRLDNEPEHFSLRDLHELVTLTMDRSGFGPKSVVKHEHGLDTRTQQLLKEAVDKENADNIKTIEGSLSGNPEPAIGDANTTPALVYSGDAEVVEFPKERTEVRENGRNVPVKVLPEG